ADREHDRHLAGGGLGFGDHGRGQGVDELHAVFFEIFRGLLRQREVAFDVFDLKHEVLAFLPAGFLESLAKSVEGLVLGAAGQQNADAQRLGRLRPERTDRSEIKQRAGENDPGFHKFETTFRRGCIGRPSNSTLIRYRERSGTAKNADFRDSRKRHTSDGSNTPAAGAPIFRAIAQLRRKSKSFNREGSSRPATRCSKKATGRWRGRAKGEGQKAKGEEDGALLRPHSLHVICSAFRSFIRCVRCRPRALAAAARLPWASARARTISSRR